MKILFNFRKGFPALREGLISAGCSLIENQWQPSQADLDGVDACIINLYEGIAHPFRTWRLKAKLKARNIPLIGIDRDAPWYKGVRARRLWLFRALGLLDIYASHSLQNAGKFAKTVLYLPNAAWTSQYNLHGATLEAMRQPDWYRYDVSFVGNLDAVRYREHSKRAAFFSELAERLTALGITPFFRHSENMSTAEQVEIIQRSQISLNYGAACDDGPERSWGLPERCYGVPACGGFLLSDERRHAEKDFLPGKEWVSFDDMEDCVAKIQYYLAHFEDARAIAEAAYHRVMHDHTYARRAEQLEDAISRWRAGARSPADAGCRMPDAEDTE